MACLLPFHFPFFSLFSCLVFPPFFDRLHLRDTRAVACLSFFVAFWHRGLSLTRCSKEFSMRTGSTPFLVFPSPCHHMTFMWPVPGSLLNLTPLSSVQEKPFSFFVITSTKGQVFLSFSLKSPKTDLPPRIPSTYPSPRPSVSRNSLFTSDQPLLSD